ncbi:hypothetical protein P8452_52920 [Trifolium repens]|nr:hypothetical protein P8452_52920 [Trifolium repens]
MGEAMEKARDHEVLDCRSKSQYVAFLSKKLPLELTISLSRNLKRKYSFTELEFLRCLIQDLRLLGVRSP